MDLSTAADVVQIVGGVTIVGGILFGAVQLRHFQRQRKDAAAQLFIQQWSGERMRDLDVVYRLPDAAPPDLAERNPETTRAANAVYVNLEQLGLLVHGRTIDIRAANEWAGGAVRVCWRKLRPWIESKRAAAGSERPGEWFQWLAERMAALPARDEKTGAHEAHRAWRP